jgi:hypothetical protein
LLGVRLVSHVSDGASPPFRLDTTLWPRTNHALSRPTRQGWRQQSATPPGESIAARARSMPRGVLAWLVIIGAFVLSFVAVGAVARRQRRRHGVQSDKASPSAGGRAAAVQPQRRDEYGPLRSNKSAAIPRSDEMRGEES